MNAVLPWANEAKLGTAKANSLLVFSQISRQSRLDIDRNMLMACLAFW